MNRNKVLYVTRYLRVVGTMAETADHRYAFAYEQAMDKKRLSDQPVFLAS